MSVQTCLVSIIVPVYNAEKELNKCVDSLIKQSLKDIEIIIINDGSTDKSAEICDEYALLDSRIKVIHLNNGGPARARNYGIKLAKGQYIGFVDADDYVDYAMFEKLYKNAQTDAYDISMCNVFLDMEGSYRPLINETYEKCKTTEEVRENILQRFYTNRHKGLYSLCNKIFRRELIEQNNILIDEHLKRGEDAWFVFSCLKVAKSFSFINECLYYYYQNNTSIMHTIQMDQYERWIENREKLLNENKEFGFSIDYTKYYSEFLYKVAVYCRDLMGNGETKKVKEILKDKFLCDAIRYCKGLPFHIVVLHRLTKWKCWSVVLLCYKVWSLMNEK